jgi:hypothetical protein
MFPVDENYHEENAAPESGNTELSRQAEIPESQEKENAGE